MGRQDTAYLLKKISYKLGIECSESQVQFVKIFFSYKLGNECSESLVQFVKIFDKLGKEPFPSPFVTNWTCDSETSFPSLSKIRFSKLRVGDGKHSSKSLVRLGYISLGYFFLQTDNRVL